MDKDRDARLIDLARNYLTETDLKVADIGFRFIEDYTEGYGHFWDGQEAVIVLAQGWLMGQVAGSEPLPQVETTMKSTFDGKEYTVSKYRDIQAPFGSHSQNVTSPGYDSGPEDDDDEYTGLNIDDDCAVSELLSSVAYAYSFYSSDHDIEIDDKWKAMFEELGLNPDKNAKRVLELEQVVSKLLKKAGKHDRNEKLWC
jgi:hypothetical protein